MKTLTGWILVILAILIIGFIVWPKNGPTEPKTNVNTESKTTAILVDPIDPCILTPSLDGCKKG